MEEKTDLKKELVEIAYVLSQYSGNSITNYQPFDTLMLEQKINVLSDAILLLIARTVELEASQTKDTTT